MAQIGIAEAAKLVGRDRKTLYLAIKKGRLTATVNDSGVRQVDTTELMRVYGAFHKVNSGATVEIPHDTTPQIALLEMENRHLKERLAEKDQHLEDMRNTVRLLEHKAPKKSWWKF